MFYQDKCFMTKCCLDKCHKPLVFVSIGFMPNFSWLDKVEDEFLKRNLIFVPIQTGHRQISIKLSSLFHFSLVGSPPPIDNKFLCILINVCIFALFACPPFPFGLSHSLLFITICVLPLFRSTLVPAKNQIKLSFTGKLVGDCT